jgi:hypothetical protein
MSIRAYTLDDVAREFGRSRDWASKHWPDLVRDKKLPEPLLKTGSPVWDRAHVYAHRDKHLSPAARATAIAWRAALDAAHAAPADAVHQDEIADSRKRLDRRFGGTSGNGDART